MPRTRCRFLLYLDFEDNIREYSRGRFADRSEPLLRRSTFASHFLVEFLSAAALACPLTRAIMRLENCWDEAAGRLPGITDRPLDDDPGAKIVLELNASPASLETRESP